MKRKIRRYAAGLFRDEAYFFFIPLFARAASPSLFRSAQKVNPHGKQQISEKVKADLRRKKGLSEVQMDKSLQRAAEITGAELTVRYSQRTPRRGMPGHCRKNWGGRRISLVG